MVFLSVVIPAHNEEERLPKTLTTLTAFLSPLGFSYEIIVVDNASSDKTSDIVLEYKMLEANLKLVKEKVRGKGIAVRTGMFSAQGEYRFMCDADLSMPIEELRLFLPPLLKTDIGIGIRSKIIGEPIRRRLSGKIFNLLVNFFLPIGIKDTQCGFKIFSREAADLIFSKQTINGWSFDVELLYIARLHGFTISEIPITWYFDSKSKIRLLRDSWMMLRDILKIRKNSRNGVYI